MPDITRKLEHSKNYLVNIAVFNNLEFREPVDLRLNYLATSFEIIHTGGSEFVNQKGRSIASTFKTQPSVSVAMTCYIREPDFPIIISRLVTGQQEILLTVGKLKRELSFNDIVTQIDESAVIFEIVGFISDARISGKAGEFLMVDFTVKADEINELNPNEIPPFNP